jgi:hypothetical protein
MAHPKVAATAAHVSQALSSSSPSPIVLYAAPSMKKPHAWTALRQILDC